MALILTALYLLHGSLNVDGAPLSVILPRQRDISPAFPQDCICPDTRSRWGIVQSCLATIFICTWVSVHPNIPPLGEPHWKKVFRRLELMFWSIVAPELVIFWAAKQWAAAREIAAKYKDHGWTIRHGYFIQMGGFMLYDNNKPVAVLDPDELDKFFKEGKVVMPQITEDEIQDRSKSDGLSKGLVVVQTTWFIAQCIARWVQGLITTELELATLAFAALNGVMYMFWWFKPLDVQTAVRVNLLPPRPQKVSVAIQADVMDQTQNSHASQEPSYSALEITRPSLPNPERVSVDPADAQVDIDRTTPPAPDSICEVGRDDVTGRSTETETDHESLIPSESSETRPYQSMKSSKFQDSCFWAWWFISGILFRWLVLLMAILIMRITEIFNTTTVDKGAMGMPTFYTTYAPPALNKKWEDLTVLNSLPFVGLLFGAIHCTGWDFFFPSPIEAKIWHVSSAFITSAPAVFLGIQIYVLLQDHFGAHFSVPKSLVNKFVVQKIVFIFGVFLELFVLLTLVLYTPARLTLLVVALTTLRDLPPGALAAVKWTSFLPHIMSQI